MRLSIKRQCDPKKSSYEFPCQSRIPWQSRLPTQCSVYQYNVILKEVLINYHFSLEEGSSCKLPCLGYLLPDESIHKKTMSS